MRLKLTVTTFETDPTTGKKTPTVSGIDGELIVTDDDMLRLAQLMFAAAVVTAGGRPKAATPREAIAQARELLDELRKAKLWGRQQVYNDEEREKFNARP